MIDPKCKLCRRQAEKLFLKGDRCYSQKCAVVKKPYPPGTHGKSRRRPLSEFGKQLQEKQRLRRLFGLSETQFSKYVREALKKKSGDKSEHLVRILESRLDNVVYRLGLAKSRNQARQIVGHGHVLVNGKRVNIPSFSVKPKQVVALKPKFLGSTLIESQKMVIKKHNTPSWLDLNRETFEGTVIRVPEQSDLEDLGRVQSILEFYSR